MIAFQLICVWHLSALIDGNEYSEFEEEVFAEDGEVEEYFAYDSPGP